MCSHTSDTCAHTPQTHDTCAPQTGQCCFPFRHPSTPSTPPPPAHLFPSFPPLPTQRCHPPDDRQEERLRLSASAPQHPPFALQVDDLKHQWSKRWSPKHAATAVVAIPPTHVTVVVATLVEQPRHELVLAIQSPEICLASTVPEACAPGVSHVPSSHALSLSHTHSLSLSLSVCLLACLSQVEVSSHQKRSCSCIGGMSLSLYFSLRLYMSLYVSPRLYISLPDGGMSPPRTRGGVKRDVRGGVGGDVYVEGAVLERRTHPLGVEPLPPPPPLFSPAVAGVKVLNRQHPSVTCK